MGQQTYKGIVASLIHPPLCALPQLMLQVAKGRSGRSSLIAVTVEFRENSAPTPSGGGGVYGKTLHPHQRMVVGGQAERIQPRVGLGRESTRLPQPPGVSSLDSIVSSDSSDSTSKAQA